QHRQQAQGEVVAGELALLLLEPLLALLVVLELGRLGLEQGQVLVALALGRLGAGPQGRGLVGLGRGAVGRRGGLAVGAPGRRGGVVLVAHLFSSCAFRPAGHFFAASVKKALTLSSQLVRCGGTCFLSSSASSRSSSSCLLVSCRGVSTTTWTCRLPRRRLRTFGIPCPGSVTTSWPWTPRGRAWVRTLPST